MERSTTLSKFFAGLAESTFQTRLGVADPPLIDYLSGLMVRFIRSDVVYKLRDLSGRRLDDVVGMLDEAEQRVGTAKRAAHRHVGDFALFWTGVYPESLRKRQDQQRRDHLIDYTNQGKRAYLIASTIPAAEGAPTGDVLARLSAEFEMCAYGLREVRRELESGDDSNGLPPAFFLR